MSLDDEPLRPVHHRQPILCSGAERDAYARHLKAQRKLRRAAWAALDYLTGTDRDPIVSAGVAGELAEALVAIEGAKKASERILWGAR